MHFAIRAWIILFSFNICKLSTENGNYEFVHSSPIVKTKYGEVKGKYEHIQGYGVTAFLGIPFAEPPLGERRFQKPEPTKPWEGIYDATKFSSPCIQINDRPAPWSSQKTPSEDCLYLNIWIPGECPKARLWTNEKLPVMIWIHGGGFSTGSTDVDAYDGSTLALYGNVIVVSMNYRVGAFGFLDAGIPDAPGNVGMHDQQLAMKWVKDNIENFGGHPECITVFGESAGAISIGLHMVSPASKGLFKRAIMQSGAAYHPLLALNQTIVKLQGSQFAAVAGCADTERNLLTDSEAVVKCLKGKDPMELAKSEAALRGKNLLYFIPTMGNEFLPKYPGEVLESGKFDDVQLLIGNNKDEGSLFLIYMVPEFFNLQAVAPLGLESASALIQGMFQNSGIPPEDVANFYLRNATEDDQNSITKAVYDSFGDYIIVCPSVFTAEKMQNDVHYYVFTHRASNTIIGDWAGTSHFEDVAFVFGLPIKHRQFYTAEEELFSRDIIRKWTTFARTGSPIGGLQNEEWPNFTENNPVYRELNLSSKNLGSGIHTEACNFWRKYYKPQA